MTTFFETFNHNIAGLTSDNRIPLETRLENVIAYCQDLQRVIAESKNVTTGGIHFCDPGVPCGICNAARIVSSLPDSFAARVEPGDNGDLHNS
jgi:hypothetical protein